MKSMYLGISLLLESDSLPTLSPHPLLHHPPPPPPLITQLRIFRFTGNTHKSQSAHTFSSFLPKFILLSNDRLTMSESKYPDLFTCTPATVLKCLAYMRPSETLFGYDYARNSNPTAVITVLILIASSLNCYGALFTTARKKHR